jgi:phospholipid/cholesterol/gamma-HCH transport system substrate-binding protein
VKSPTLIGSEYIEIQSGSPKSLPIPAYGQIPAKDPKTIDDIIAALQLEQKLQQVEAIMMDLASLTNSLQDPEGPLLGTLANVRTVTQNISEGQGTLGALISQETAYQEILTTLKQLREVSESLNNSATALNRDIPNITTKVDLILREIEGGTRSFPEVARTTREGLRDVHQIIDSAKKNFLIRSNLTPDVPPANLIRTVRDN